MLALEVACRTTTYIVNALYIMEPKVINHFDYCQRTKIEINPVFI